MRHLFLPENPTPAVRAEQIRLLYSQGSTIQILGIVTALVSVSALWPVADHTLLIIWLCIMISVSLVRLGVNSKFPERSASDESLAIWGNLYIAGTFVSGVIWGILAFLYDPSWPAPYQVILFIVYTGITAGAFNTNSSLFWAFPAFYLPPSLCLMFVMLQQSEQGFFELTALFGIYVLLMYVTTLRFHKRLTSSLKIRFNNEQLATRLEDANRNLSQLVERDELTGLHNRRSMDKFLASEWNRHHRNRLPLSLLFIDLDYFKQYNDEYGHQEGDKCLLKVANLLQKHAQRSTDMAARFGGEEFAVILPDTRESEALLIAHRIRSGLQALNLPHTGSEITDRVTMSIGVSTAIPRRLNAEESLVLAADQALYRAKDEGRDRVITGSPR